jgi:hypothetical protein
MGRLAKWNRGASRVALRDTPEPPSGFDAVTVYASAFVKSAPPRPSTPADLRTNASETEWDLTDKRSVPGDDVFVTTAQNASPPPKAAYPRPPPGQPHRSKVILAHDPRPYDPRAPVHTTPAYRTTAGDAYADAADAVAVVRAFHRDRGLDHNLNQRCHWNRTASTVSMGDDAPHEGEGVAAASRRCPRDARPSPFASATEPPSAAPPRSFPPPPTVSSTPPRPRRGSNRRNASTVDPFRGVTDIEEGCYRAGSEARAHFAAPERSTYVPRRDTRGWNTASTLELVDGG